MSLQIDGQTFYRAAEACQLAGVSKSTLHRWIRECIIPDATHKDRNGWRLFTKKEVDKIRSEVDKINRD